ncbi:MAG: sugar transporter [Phaeodactylibacter sp.]|nr:sugar transporter [Phaeodactylibacter sp.]
MKYLIICMLLGAGNLQLNAQQGMPKPVTWSFQAEMINDSTYSLNFTAEIQEGWYLYAQDLDDGGPIPTTIAFDPAQDLKLLGKTEEQGKALEGMDELFQMNVKKYKNKVVFSQNAVLGKDIEMVTGYIEFMTCDDEQCLPPTEIPFAFSFRG